MGKWTDKLYITQKEWTQAHHDLNKKNLNKALQQPPFNCCHISLQPFTHPVTTRFGYHVFEKSNITEWINLNPQKVHPLIGHLITEQDLIHLTYHTNFENALYCPITRQVFNPASHIIAIATTGNVFSISALKHLADTDTTAEDPLTSVPFSNPKDILTLQLPPNLLDQTPNKQVILEGHAATPLNPTDNINTSHLSKIILNEMASTTFTPINKPKRPPTNIPVNPSSKSSSISNNKTAASFTSTSLSVHTSIETVDVSQNTEIYQQFCTEMMELRKSAAQAKGKSAKKNTNKGLGYVRISTSFGDLNIELFCVLAPRTCHNFLLLCAKGYYKNVPFHRLIPGFMIQGGDPTNTGRGGESAWGGTFDDEIRPSMRHDKRGLLCMANRGNNTNTSQFFITFAPAPHLDGKHTIFGRVVGGFEVLDRMESIATTKSDTPVSPILITDVQVFVDPILQYIELDKNRKAQAIMDQMSYSDRVMVEGTWLRAPRLASKEDSGKPVIGKYLNNKRVLGDDVSRPFQSSGLVGNRLFQTTDVGPVPKRQK